MPKPTTVTLPLSDQRTVDVKGTVLFRDETRAYVLVEDESGGALWIVDTLDDAGVCLDYLQLSVLMPFISEWMESFRQRNP